MYLVLIGSDNDISVVKQVSMLTYHQLDLWENMNMSQIKVYSFMKVHSEMTFASLFDHTHLFHNGYPWSH